ncbi:hypothetical protein [Nostoc sp.]|uniref:hypothetical protein n=1 Tax=Nostoc sp. TaxID=1180 RepID=UPI002FF55123
MPDKPTNNCPQLNVRLDKHPTLLDEIKTYASDRNIIASEFLLNTIKAGLIKHSTSILLVIGSSCCYFHQFCGNPVVVSPPHLSVHQVR